MKEESMKKQVNYGNYRFYLEEAERGYDLYRLDLIPDPDGDHKEKLLRRGLEDGRGSGLIRQGDFLYIKFREPVAAYLKLDMRDEGRKQTIIQNVELLEVREDGHGILFHNLVSDKICFADSGETPLEIAPYDKNRQYLIQDRYILAKPWDLKDKPVRYTFDGTGPLEASPQENAWCFWETIAKANTLIYNYPGSDEVEEYFEERFRNTLLTLRDMEDMFMDIAKRGLWRRKTAFPFQGILKILKAGAEPDEDLSDVMYTLHHYAREGVVQHFDGFSRIFYFILYRLAKERNDFMSLLRHDPETLFREHLLHEEDPAPDAGTVKCIIDMMNMDMDLDRPNRIGGFDFDYDGNLVSDSVEIPYGKVLGRFVIHKTDRTFRGIVSYDLVLGEPDIQWLGDEDLSEYCYEEVKTAFRI